ncbi:MAG: hypothetical protein K9H26_16940 [Prolixibacteraceae bacterium]|nr:hypothetical protein [Prolixibacteraceae bacterium]
MKNKNYLISILIISIIALSAGLYFKFMKSYTDEKFQIKTTKNIERQPNLGETIKYLEELDAIKSSVTSDKSNNTLKRLKTINLTSIIVMVISIIGVIGATQKLITKREN